MPGRRATDTRLADENAHHFSPETHLSYFEPVLHDSVHLPAQERCQFVAWAQSRVGPERSKYDNAVPSLRRVVKLLRHR